MKRTYDGNIYNSAISASAKASALTDDEKKALAEEIKSDPKGRGYAGKTAVEILWLLGNEYQEPNPEPRGYVPYKNMPTSWLYNEVFKAKDQNGKRYWHVLKDRSNDANATIASICTDAVDLLTSDVTPLTLVEDDGTDSELKQAIAGLVALGVFPESLKKKLTECADPDWPEYLEPKRRLWELFGEGSVIDLADIEEAING